jgi:hypothetical protein
MVDLPNCSGVRNQINWQPKLTSGIGLLIGSFAMATESGLVKKKIYCPSQLIDLRVFDA